MTWRYTPDGESMRTYIEHLAFPRFTAEFVDDTDPRAEVQIEGGDALGRFAWLDPRPSDDEVRLLAQEADVFAQAQPTR